MSLECQSAKSSTAGLSHGTKFKNDIIFLQMTRNPFINALCAIAYIVFIGAVMYFLSQTQSNKPDTFLAPILILSVFTLSAAVMGYLFLYQPLLLLIDGKKKQAVNLFLRTVAIFAGITAVIFLLLISGAIK